MRKSGFGRSNTTWVFFVKLLFPVENACGIGSGGFAPVFIHTFVADSSVATEPRTSTTARTAFCNTFVLLSAMGLFCFLRGRGRFSLSAQIPYVPLKVNTILSKPPGREYNAHMGNSMQQKMGGRSRGRVLTYRRGAHFSFAGPALWWSRGGPGLAALVLGGEATQGPSSCPERGAQSCPERRSDSIFFDKGWISSRSPTRGAAAHKHNAGAVLGVSKLGGNIVRRVRNVPVAIPNNFCRKPMVCELVRNTFRNVLNRE